MNYKKCYEDLISTRKERGIKRSTGDGFNLHHIIPKCLGGTNDPSNLVKLTYKEHLVAHHLLHKIYPSNKGLAHAFLMMTRSKTKYFRVTKEGKPIKLNLSFNELEELREQSLEHLREISLGKQLSDDTKRKLSESHKGKTATKETKALLSRIRKGHTLSKDSREKLSNSRKGMIFSETHKENLSKNRKGIPLPKEALNKISGANAFAAKKIIGPDGRVFNTINECCEFLKISRNTLVSRISKNPEFGYKYLNNDQNIRKSTKVIGPDGTLYNSIKECARKINRAKCTIKRWLDDPNSGYKRL